ncbi:MAG: response regulator transcription factor [Acidimicrobiales bacterium]
MIEAPPRTVDLTRREQEVLAGIADGLSSAEIGARLFLSVNSIKTHTRLAYRKIGVHSRAQATRWWLIGGMADSA